MFFKWSTAWIPYKPINWSNAFIALEYCQLAAQYTANVCNFNFNCVNQKRKQYMDMCHPSHPVGSFLNTSSSQISHYNHSRKLEHSHGGTYGRQAWNQETILQYNSAWLFFSHWSQPHCVMLTPNAYHSQFTLKALNWHNTVWLLLCSSHTKQCSSELEMMSKYNTWHAGCCVCNYTHHVHQDMMTNYWLTPSIKPCEFVWLFS